MSNNDNKAANSPKTSGAVEAILNYYHVKAKDIPDNILDMNDQLEYLLRPYGIMWRTVLLSDSWYKDAVGPMLGMRKSDRSTVAFIPNGISGYSYIDSVTGRKIKITSKNSQLFFNEAVTFYKPFPLKKMDAKSLFRYLVGTISVTDYLAVAVTMLIIALLGLLTPKLNNIVFSSVVYSGSTRLLLAIMIFMLSASLSTCIMNAFKSLLTTKIGTRMSVTVQAATMMRVLSLPVDFFKNYSSGNLSTRVQQMNSLCEMLVSVVLTSGLTAVFSLVYVGQIFRYAPSLAVPAIIIILITIIFSVLSSLAQRKIMKEQMELKAKESGMSYAVISGVQKIKLSGAEKRAFDRWGKLYDDQAELIYNPPLFIKITPVISTAISLAGTVVLYYVAVKSSVAVADYFSFNVAYGMTMGAFMAFAGIATQIAQIKPVLEVIMPIFENDLEIEEGKQVVTSISGGIELENVSFRYSDSMPNVIDNLSLKIEPGQYVAIVGSTGCGKSTLMRLMMGFEKAQSGTISYDGMDINTIDQRSLRKHIGAVMQSGKLFQGNIFSNITISAPKLNLNAAWEVAQLAGIAEDIKRMPMGMFTIISEGSGGISGGQKQRLLIARAIAPKPKILMFDEATSALDNISQKVVSDSLDMLRCTRIVIAHRLSTIKNCDRIIVLNEGHIIEDGTYDELIDSNGFFAELVERQRLS